MSAIFKAPGLNGAEITVEFPRSRGFMFGIGTSEALLDSDLAICLADWIHAVVGHYTCQEPPDARTPGEQNHTQTPERPAESDSGLIWSLLASAWAEGYLDRSSGRPGTNPYRKETR